MHVGQPHGDGLPQTEAPPRTHADEFLTVRIVLEPVVAERREPHHAFDGHLVELHEKAELRHPGNDAGERLAGALPQQEAPETAGDFPFGLGRGAFSGVALVRRHKQLVPGEDRPRRRAERKGQRPVHQQVGIAPDG